VPGADRHPAAVGLALAVGGLAISIDLRPDPAALLELSGRLNAAAEAVLGLPGGRP
jgi:hypothetical protein